jgi:D-3-phosphoglycerate dehydrogenase
MMLSLLRRVAEMDRVVRQGGWKKHTGTLLKGKKAGIIGFGRIGQKVADILRAFSAEIGYYDAKGDGKVGDHRFMPFEELLRWGDIFSVHIAARSGDLPVIGDNEIKQMKEGVYILNLSRGGAVSEQALEKYLKNGKVAGAGLDVFAKEPYTGELARFENVILTPHIGSYAKESRVEMEKRSMENLLGALEGTR